MTPPAPENESPLEQWLLAYDSLLAGDLAALPPMAAESVASVNLQQAQVCLQMLELDRLSQQLDPSSSQAVSDDAGQRFQRFRLIRKLGEGGFGVVFLRKTPRFSDWSRLRSPSRKRSSPKNVGSGFWLSLERSHSCPSSNRRDPRSRTVRTVLLSSLAILCGWLVADWLTRHGQNGVPWETAIGWIEQVGDSIQYAHEHGVWHCDLKPSNILLVPVDPAVSCDDKASTAYDGRLFGFRCPISVWLAPSPRHRCLRNFPHLCDFGIRLWEGHSPTWPQSNVIPGSLRYPFEPTCSASARSSTKS